MIVQCNQCSTKFRINEANVGPRGAKVRCSRCQNVFTVTPPGKEAAGNDFASDRTHAFDTSQFMRAAGAQAPAKGPAVAPKAPSPAKDDATSVVDASAFLAQMKNPAGGGGAKENATQVVDARAFMNQLKSTGVAAQAGFGGTDNATRVMSVPDVAKLTGAPPSLPPLPSAHTEETRVGPVTAKTGESRFPVAGPHDQPTQVSGIFAQANASPWGPDEAGSDLPSAGLTEAPAAATAGPQGRPPGQNLAGARLSDETVQAPIPEVSVEAVSMAPPPAMSWAITGLAVLVLVLGGAVYVGAEQLLAIASVKFGSVPAVLVDDTPVNGLHLLPVRAQLYPLTPTDVAWVVTGRVENTTQVAVRDVDAVAELHDRLGRVVGQVSAPVGLELDPSEIPTVPADLQDTVEKALRALPPPGVGPGAQAPFVAVLLDPPLPLSNLPQVVHLAVRPPPPAAAPEPAPPPAAAPLVAEPPPPPLPTLKKGKLLKGKGKHRKGAVAAPLSPP